LKSNAQLEVGKPTVRDLFEADRRYVVPLYQRPYVWTETRQWEPLWDDVTRLIESSASSNGYPEHFMGAIVLQHVPKPVDAIPEFTIIDGQQRLTTLQILLSAAAKAAASESLAEEAELLREVVENRHAEGDEIFKVWPTNQNRVAFRAAIGDTDIPASPNKKNTIQEAHAFFESRILEWLGKQPPDGLGSAMKRLRVALINQLRLVSITLHDQDDPQVIFETLNDRGEPLAALDLVKNAVFQDALRSRLDTDAIHSSVWEPILDDQYWRDERIQGRLRRSVGDLFLMHWLTMRLSRVVLATELFSTFRERELGPKRTQPADQLIRTLCHDARVYRSFDSFESGTVEGEFFGRLEALDTAAVYPLVLALFTATSIDDDRRTRSLQILESWFVRRAVMGLSTKSYTNLVVEWLKLPDIDTVPDAALLSQLRQYHGSSNEWPSDEAIEKRLQDEPLYKHLRADRIAMLLRAIELRLRASAEDFHVSKHLTVEHIIPQKWQKNWKPEEGNEEAEALREAAIHLLGNLTVTKGALNASLSNKPWSQKRDALYEKGTLVLNGQLLARYPDKFDESCITARGHELAKQIVEIWPGPDADW